MHEQNTPQKTYVTVIIIVQPRPPSDENKVEIFMAEYAVIHAGLQNTRNMQMKVSHTASKRCYLHHWAGYSTSTAAVWSMYNRCRGESLCSCKHWTTKPNLQKQKCGEQCFLPDFQSNLIQMTIIKTNKKTGGWVGGRSDKQSKRMITRNFHWEWQQPSSTYEKAACRPIKTMTENQDCFNSEAVTVTRCTVDQAKAESSPSQFL